MTNEAWADPSFNWTLQYYISGPMSGLPDYNYQAFADAQAALTQTGIRAVSPHAIDFKETEETRGTKPYEHYLKAAFMLLLQSDAIIMLKGWPDSRGARAELDIAMDLKFPVYYYHDWMLTDMNKRKS